ncbi:MAG: ribonuclease Z [Desulfurococcales archaeon]|nr:ribonuclease Z [Desulfurococcales archaeon]
MIKIGFLGTGAGAPTLNRWASSILISIGSSNYILDCGEGCQLRLSMLGVSPLKITAMFITHEHGDHVLGISPLIESMSHYGRKSSLSIVAPTSVANIIREVIMMTSRGTGFEIDYKTPEKGYEDSYVSVTGYRTCHSDESWGYRLNIRRKGLSICYTGDTGPCETIAEKCRGADILIHEATFTQENVEEAKVSMHSTAYDAARLAQAIGAKYLYLTHISSRYRDQNLILREAQSIFRNTRIAEDLMVTYII